MFGKSNESWLIVGLGNPGKDYAHKVYVDGENGLKTFEEIVNFSLQLF